MSNIYKAANGLEIDLDYKPDVFVEDIEKLSNDEWLEKRRTGIGGSDYGVLYGLSPFNTTKDLYLDKVGLKERLPEGEEDNWAAKEIGHRLEEVVAMIFYKKTGIQPYAVRKMFRHPKYYWMLADVDYFVDITDRDGNVRTYILEIKTTAYNNKDKWGTEFSPAVPYTYQLQTRSYCAVCNVSGVIICCLFDNNENSLFIRRVDRDLDIEAEIVEAGRNFWQNNVEKRVEPIYTEDGDMVLKSVRNRLRNASKINNLELDGDDTVENGDEEYTLEELVDKYFEYSKEKSKYEKKRMEYESQMKKIQAFIETKTNVSEGLIILNDNAEKNCQIKYSKRCRTSINKESLEKMQIVDKELYDELVGKGYLTTSECNIFKPKYVRKGND